MIFFLFFIYLNSGLVYSSDYYVSSRGSSSKCTNGERCNIISCITKINTNGDIFPNIYLKEGYYDLILPIKLDIVSTLLISGEGKDVVLTQSFSNSPVFQIGGHDKIHARMENILFRFFSDDFLSSSNHIDLVLTKTRFLGFNSSQIFSISSNLSSLTIDKTSFMDTPALLKLISTGIYQQLEISISDSSFQGGSLLILTDGEFEGINIMFDNFKIFKNQEKGKLPINSLILVSGENVSFQIKNSQVFENNKCLLEVANGQINSIEILNSRFSSNYGLLNLNLNKDNQRGINLLFDGNTIFEMSPIDSYFGINIVDNSHKNINITISNNRFLNNTVGFLSLLHSDIFNDNEILDSTNTIKISNNIFEFSECDKCDGMFTFQELSSSSSSLNIELNNNTVKNTLRSIFQEYWSQQYFIYIETKIDCSLHAVLNKFIQNRIGIISLKKISSSKIEVVLKNSSFIGNEPVSSQIRLNSVVQDEKNNATVENCLFLENDIMITLLDYDFILHFTNFNTKLLNSQFLRNQVGLIKLFSSPYEESHHSLSSSSTTKSSYKASIVSSSFEGNSQNLVIIQGFFYELIVEKSNLTDNVDIGHFDVTIDNDIEEFYTSISSNQFTNNRAGFMFYLSSSRFSIHSQNNIFKDCTRSVYFIHSTHYSISPQSSKEDNIISSFIMKYDQLISNSDDTPDSTVINIEHSNSDQRMVFSLENVIFRNNSKLKNFLGDQQSSPIFLTAASGGTIDFTISNHSIISSNRGISGGVVSTGYWVNTIEFVDSFFIDNYGIKDGGVVYSTIDCSVRISNCTFLRNQAGFGDGGAVSFNEGKELVISNSIFLNNTANSSNGGSVMFSAPQNYQEPSLFKFEDSTILFSSANYGAGLFLSFGDGENHRFEVICSNENNDSNCLISSNFAKKSGGGIYIQYTTFPSGDIPSWFFDQKVVGNRANWDGENTLSQPTSLSLDKVVCNLDQSNIRCIMINVKFFDYFNQIIRFYPQRTFEVFFQFERYESSGYYFEQLNTTFVSFEMKVESNEYLYTSEKCIIGLGEKEFLLRDINVEVIGGNKKKEKKKKKNYKDLEIILGVSFGSILGFLFLLFCVCCMCIIFFVLCFLVFSLVVFCFNNFRQGGKQTYESIN